MGTKLLLASTPGLGLDDERQPGAAGFASGGALFVDLRSGHRDPCAVARRLSYTLPQPAGSSCVLECHGGNRALWQHCATYSFTLLDALDGARVAGLVSHCVQLGQMGLGWASVQNDQAVPGRGCSEGAFRQAGLPMNGSHGLSAREAAIAATASRRPASTSIK